MYVDEPQSKTKSRKMKNDSSSSRDNSSSDEFSSSSSREAEASDTSMDSNTSGVVLSTHSKPSTPIVDTKVETMVLKKLQKDFLQKAKIQEQQLKLREKEVERKAKLDLER